MNARNPQSSRIRYVACISYPRSGHHLTVRVLKSYFGSDLRYCQSPAFNQDCCRQCPCIDESITLSKNHDLALDRPFRWGLSKSPETPFLILMRNFFEAAISDYNLYLQNHEDRLRTWRAFSKRKLRYYQRFIGKWVLDDDGLEKLVVSYEDMTADPLTTFGKIVEFFKPPESVDSERLSEIIRNATLAGVSPTGIELVRNFGVQNRRRIEDFQHYDPKYFAELERKLAPVLLQTGYRLRYAA